MIRTTLTMRTGVKGKDTIGGCEKPGLAVHLMITLITWASKTLAFHKLNSLIIVIGQSIME